MDIQQDDDEEDIQQDDELEPELVVDHHVVAVNEMQYKGLRLRGYKKKRSNKLLMLPIDKDFNPITAYRHGCVARYMKTCKEQRWSMPR